MYRLLFALIVSLLAIPSYGASQIVGKYDNEGAIYQEFNNVFNHVQDKEFTVKNSTPTANDGRIVIHATGTYVALYFGYKNSTNTYYIELKKK